MILTIASAEGGAVFNLEVSPDIELENLLVLVSMECDKPTEQIQLAFNGVPLIDTKKTLADYNVADNSVLLMMSGAPSQSSGGAPRGAGGSGGAPRAAAPSPMKIDWGAIQVPGSAPHQPAVDECEKLRTQWLSDAHALSNLRARDPTWAATVNDKEAFKKQYEERQEMVKKRKREEEIFLTGNPMDPEYQKKLYEMLQAKQVQENMEHAMEEHPESFGQVVMLYIDVEINGHAVKAFVDSGAQMTLISSSCAEWVNVARLIDKRFQGLAKGVGTQKILGRVHLLPLKIGEDHFPCTFSVLEHQPMDMLLGLDMLKRHQCIIDLKENCLRIGTTGSRANFLAECDIPKQQEEADQPSTAAGSAEVDDSKIAKLTQMGFTADQARKALSTCNNDEDQAASLLFEKGGNV